MWPLPRIILTLNTIDKSQLITETFQKNTKQKLQRNGVMNKGNGSFDLAIKVSHKLANLDLREARASKAPQGEVGGGEVLGETR